MKDQTRKEVSRAVQRVISKSTKRMHQDQSGAGESQRSFSKQDLRAALKRVQNRELNAAQRKSALNVYMIMKNSNLCASNPNCAIGKNERTTFHGDDIDYAYPYSHRYNEPDSERGATDE